MWRDYWSQKCCEGVLESERNVWGPIGVTKCVRGGLLSKKCMTPLESECMRPPMDVECVRAYWSQNCMRAIGVRMGEGTIGVRNV